MGQFIKRLLLHQICPEAREIPFIDFGKPIKQQPRNHTIQNRITKKFEAFVVGSAVTAVCQCLFQQAWCLEPIADPHDQRSMRRVCGFITLIVQLLFSHMRDTVGAALANGRRGALP